MITRRESDLQQISLTKLQKTLREDGVYLEDVPIP